MFAGSHSQQTRGIHPMMFQCWHTVFDAGPTLKQNWVNAPCLLGIYTAFWLWQYRTSPEVIKSDAGFSSCRCSTRVASTKNDPYTAGWGEGGGGGAEKQLTLHMGTRCSYICYKRLEKPTSPLITSRLYGQSRKAVSANFYGKQILPFGFAEQCNCVPAYMKH